jgi:hypothetical protein
MSDEEKVVVFMTLPRGVDDPLFQVFSPAGAFQFTCRSAIWRVKGDMSRFKFPLPALKMLGKRSMTQNRLENS